MGFFVISPILGGVLAKWFVQGWFHLQPFATNNNYKIQLPFVEINCTSMGFIAPSILSVISDCVPGSRFA
jgi:hypothetical protein